MFRIILTFILLLHLVISSKILYINFVPSHSHHLWHKVLLEALAKRGHDITYANLDEYNDKPQNVTQILIEDIYRLTHDMNYDEITSHGNVFSNINHLSSWCDLTSGAIVQSKGIQQFIKIVKQDRFDVILFDPGTAEFAIGIWQHVGRPPIVGLSPFGCPTWLNRIIGNPMQASTLPHFLLPVGNRDMGLMDRINNLLVYIYSEYVRVYRHFKLENAHSRKLFGPDTMNLEQVLDNINVILYNEQIGTYHQVANVPGMVPMGGLHIKKPKPLPQDLQDYMDTAPQGVIYFSFGSNIPASQMPENVRKMFLDAFKELAPVKVIWKFETELPDRPDNVMIRKWLPQSDIFAHPNIRLFITHSGMLSTQEAMYHGIPLVSIPFFLDQHINSEKCVEEGIGEQLVYRELTKDKILKVLQKVLHDKSYKESMLNKSIIFKDNLVDPLESSMYWIEYVIRHKGAKHLRSKSKQLHWYQLYNIDVLLLLFIIVYIVYKILFILLMSFRTSSKIKFE